MKTHIEWPTWPKYSSEHEQAVLRVIRSNQLYAAGEVRGFEQEFSEKIGVNHAVGVGNATQGLHLALAALGIGAGDEVIVTPYSWISSASCVLMQKAIPIFVDIEEKSFGICPEALRLAITPRTRAVILVHMFGLASQIEEISKICEEAGVPLIEDGSHAHGALYKQKHLGTFGTLGVFSLHQRKAISTGDGGVVVSNCSRISEKIRRLRSFGDPQLSYNYRMTEFSAAIGRIGLKNLPVENEIRRSNHSALGMILKGSVIRLIEPMADVHAVYYANLLDINIPWKLQEILRERANLRGIPLRRTWQPLNYHPHFRRENMENGMAPWDINGLNYVEPHRLLLEHSISYQTHRLFELDCHPLVNHETVLIAAEILTSLAEQILDETY